MSDYDVGKVRVKKIKNKKKACILKLQKSCSCEKKIFFPTFFQLDRKLLKKK